MQPEALSPHYPAFRYHRTKAPVVINSPEAEEALGEGWANTPAAFKDEAPEIAVEVEPESESIDTPKKKGRPFGSKNKPADSASE